MWLESKERKVEGFPVEKELKAKPVGSEPDQHVSPTTCCIPKSLQIHDTAEWRIEEINDW